MTPAPAPAVFVSADEAARRCMVSVDTFRAWVRAGYAPRPAVEHGQIVRWHWPTVEARLAGIGTGAHSPDPYLAGVAHVQTSPTRRPRRASAA